MIWYLIWPSSHLFWCFHGNLWAYGPPSFWRKNYFFALVKLFCPLVLFWVLVCFCLMTLALPSPLVLHTKESHGTQIFFLLNSISKKGRISKLQIYVNVKDIFTSLKECHLARLQNPIQCTEGSDVGMRGKGGLFCRLGWGVPYPPRPRAPTGRRDRGVTKSSIPEPPSLPPSSQPLAKLLSLVWGITTRRGCCAETMRNIWF